MIDTFVLLRKESSSPSRREVNLEQSLQISFSDSFPTKIVLSALVENGNKFVMKKQINVKKIILEVVFEEKILFLYEEKI